MVFEGKAVAKPAFAVASDCEVVGQVYTATCAIDTCTPTQGWTCCGDSQLNECCGTHKNTVLSECGLNADCGHKDTCCRQDSSTPCCTGLPTCQNASCSVHEAERCCKSNPTEACCHAKSADFESECSVAGCVYREYCFAYYPLSVCSVEKVPLCQDASCSMQEAAGCCLGVTENACCTAHAANLEAECYNSASCPYKVFCTVYYSHTVCIVGPPPQCRNQSCSKPEAEGCCLMNPADECCDLNHADFESECGVADCAHREYCSLYFSQSICGQAAPNPCDIASCSMREAFGCCGSAFYSGGACCQGKSADLTTECSNASCTNLSKCCIYDVASLCCAGVPSVCKSASCSTQEAAGCCIVDPANACCQAKSANLMPACQSDANCPYRHYCCTNDDSTACCTGV